MRDIIDGLLEALFVFGVILFLICGGKYRWGILGVGVVIGTVYLISDLGKREYIRKELIRFFKIISIVIGGVIVLFLFRKNMEVLIGIMGVVLFYLFCNKYVKTHVLERIININPKNKITQYHKHMSNMDEMEYLCKSKDGFDYEKRCAEILRQKGFTNIKNTKHSGDHGIDVIGCYNGIKYAIQCKYYSNKVGNHAIQEAYGGCTFYDCDTPVVLTNSTFTKNAIEEAKKLKVELWSLNRIPIGAKAIICDNKIVENKGNHYGVLRSKENYESFICECNAYVERRDIEEEKNERIKKYKEECNYNDSLMKEIRQLHSSNYNIKACDNSIDGKYNILRINDGLISKLAFNQLDKICRENIKKYLSIDDCNEHIRDIKNREMGSVNFYNAEYKGYLKNYIYRYYCNLKLSNDNKEVVIFEIYSNISSIMVTKDKTGADEIEMILLEQPEVNMEVDTLEYLKMLRNIHEEENEFIISEEHFCVDSECITFINL